MARKPAKSRSSAATKKPSVDPSERVLNAALELAAEKEWASVSMVDIARKAKMKMPQVLGVYPSKTALIAGFFLRTDHAVLAGVTLEQGASARDRLFDVLMVRFDVLAPRKAAVRSIVRGARKEILPMLCSAPRFMCSMARTLEAADISSAGIPGLIRTKGLAVVYLSALRTWLGDDSEDMGETMVSLDQGLKRAEYLYGMICSSPVRR